MSCFFAYVFCSDVFSGRLLASVFSENLLSTPFCANIFFADVSFQDFFPHTLLFHIPFPEYFQGSRFLAHAFFFHTPFPDYLCEQQVSCTCFLCCFFQRFSAPVVFEECSPEFLLHCNFFLLFLETQHPPKGYITTPFPPQSNNNPPPPSTTTPPPPE